MGKKRRYIQRANKFAKKMFNFLDKLDGARNSQLDSAKLDTVLTEINLLDRGNQTFSVSFEAMGPGDSATAGLEGDRVTYTIDGAAVHSNHIRTFGAAANTNANNRDNYITTAFAPARAGTGASDVLLSVGQHTIEAHIIKEGSTDAVSKKVKKTFDIARSEIAMTPGADFLKVHTDGDNIQMNLDQITIVGSRPGEEPPYDPSSSNGIASNGDSFKISATIKTGDDAPGLAAASHAPVTLTLSAGAENHTNKQVAKLLQSDVTAGKHVEVIVTLTARTAANADLVDTLTDTITFVVPE